MFQHGKTNSKHTLTLTQLSKQKSWTIQTHLYFHSLNEYQKFCSKININLVEQAIIICWNFFFVYWNPETTKLFIIGYCVETEFFEHYATNHIQKKKKVFMYLVENWQHNTPEQFEQKSNKIGNPIEMLTMKLCQN